MVKLGSTGSITVQSERGNDDGLIQKSRIPFNGQNKVEKDDDNKSGRLQKQLINMGVEKGEMGRRDPFVDGGRTEERGVKSGKRDSKRDME